jgi:hypothetical protein
MKTTSTDYPPETTYYVKKRSVSTIPCKGASCDAGIGWISDDYRREVAAHILALHRKELTQLETETCELYQSGQCAASSFLMDSLVITYGHELK